jgi:proteasome lid subunit RPN8/RPN11
MRHVCESIIYQHVFSNADREVGGVLVGRIAHQGAQPTITGAIPAIAADEQRAALTFTQDSWEHVHRVMDSEYPNERIVGWYHSHPAFGIFLSGHDLFIHRNFFGDRSQIALVIDPIAQEEGVFAWRQSTGDVDLYTQGPTPAGWYALGKDGRAISGRRPGQPSASERRRETRTLKLPPPYLLAVAALAGFSVAFAAAYFGLRHHDSSGRGRTVTAQVTPTTLGRATAPTTTVTATANVHPSTPSPAVTPTTTATSPAAATTAAATTTAAQAPSQVAATTTTTTPTVSLSATVTSP